MLDRVEEKRFGLTSIPFKPSVMPKPQYDGVFYKSTKPAHEIDAFKRMKNPELELIKKQDIQAVHLGPGAA